ncbi:MAG: crotonobetainyl-CoA:carnitine CoA-transferase CaiB-like acyl-CoA transferase [Paracrocinitomix sp.]|jgi:crotonobetainyl-CoA:carnitine CoA-transferase CaiB-like acyl-CoA transferase
MTEKVTAPAGGPLTGISVIDLSAVVSGPFGTSILADQGADVIVVEQVHAPDIMRVSGPLAESAQGVSSSWASMNRNKRSITLNLKDPRGRELVLALISDADVVVQNFRPGAIERLGLGWEVLHALNPDLVMCSISGFGSDGPYSHRPAFDAVVQSIAGYPTVQVDDRGEPQLMATIVCDKVTSLNVAQSVCAALVARSLGHGGQHIEIAMLDASIHFLWPDAMWNQTYMDHESDTPDLSTICKLFPTSDGWAMIYPLGTDAQWQALCEALDRPDLASDTRFADLHGRIAHGDEINEELQRETERFTTAALVKLMDEADVPTAPVNTREEMLADPQVQHRGIVQESEHPTVGRIRSVRSPALFSKTASVHTRHAPLFGQHTDEVLTELLAVSAEELVTLRTDGVIA